MDFTKMFIGAYVFFFIVVNIFGFALNIALPTIPTNENPVLNVLFFFPNVIIFLFNFLTFTTDFFYLNIILWGIRFIATLEIIILIRGNAQ